MDPTLSLLVRFVHIASVTMLVGGALLARFGAQGPAAAWSRPAVLTAIIAALASGLISLATKGDLSSSYWIGFSAKFLLALHVFAVALVLTKPGADPALRNRRMTGISISGLIVILLATWLRSLGG